MNSNINLVLGKSKPNKYQEKLLKTVKRSSVIFLGITVLSAVMLFLLNIDPSLSRIIQQKNATLTNLSFTHGKVAKYLLVKDRLLGINTILHTRSSFDDVISYIRQQATSDVGIDSLSLDKKTLTIDVSSTSLSSFDTFLTNITQMLQNKKFIKTMTIYSIMGDQATGKFSLSIKADLL